MTIYLGVTDNDWFDYLAQLRPDEANFWQPGGGNNFRVLKPGELFLFKLKAPRNVVAGGGVFVTQTQLPASLAWDAFGQKNGCASYGELLRRLVGLRRKNEGSAVDPTIGCITLAQPFFFEPHEWIDMSARWKGAIVQGKSYPVATPDGRRLYDAVMERLASRGLLPDAAAQQNSDEPIESPLIVAEEGARYGAPRLVPSRLGQGAFRLLVTDAYRRSCAMTGDHTLPVLQAAHIKPFAQSGPNDVANGLLLRADLHLLFDKGYLTVTPDNHIEVSRRIREEFNNGVIYYALHGAELKSLPERVGERPGREFLEYHNGEVFVG